MKTPALENLLVHLIRDSHQTELMLQAGLVLACGVVSWLILHLLGRWFFREQSNWRHRKHDVKSIGLPLLWLFFTAISRELLKSSHEIHLLNIVIPLLLTLVSIRVLVYLLRHMTGNRQTIRVWERSIVWVIWLGFALHITGLAPLVIHLLDSVSFATGNHRFSLLLLLEAIVVIGLSILMSLWLAQTFEERLMQTQGMDPSLRLALIKFVRSLLLILGIIIALPAVGIDITMLSVFGGALGVGLGLGLQKIASNYVSGFIILLDRSIRPGDMITVDGKYGEVRQLNTRYTLLRALDGTEIILPNETLMTSTVVNHSFTKKEVRVLIPVQIAYGSDIERARSIMRDIGNQHPRAIYNDEFHSEAFVTNLGDSGINLSLAVWIADPESGQIDLISSIYLQILSTFSAAGINIPYPTRDIHLSMNTPETGAPATDTAALGPTTHSRTSVPLSAIISDQPKV